MVVASHESAGAPASADRGRSQQQRSTRSWTTLNPTIESYPSSPATDALNFASGLEAEHDELRGGSSVLSFARSILHSVDCPAPAETSHISRLDATSTVSIRKTRRDLAPLGDTTLLLPRRTVADNFVQNFFELTHSVFPILHRPTFLELYDKLWTSDGNEEVEDPVFMATLNIIFSIGSQLSTIRTPEQRPALADQFYQQSLKFWNTTNAEVSTISEVQLLLLVAIYLQSTKHASRYWHTVGMAIRAAQELGIHLEVGRPGNECQLKREMRRRIWHSCIILDR
jgi:hypothetical protein